AVQVVDRAGQVVAASEALRGRRAVSRVRPGTGQRVTIHTVGLLRGDDGPDLTVATTVETGQGPLTVYAVSSVEGTEDSWHDTAVAMAVVLPLVVAVSGILAWKLTGRA